MFTNTPLTLVALLVASATSLPTPTLADPPSREEIPVRAVLFPATGFDDNDNVRILIEGVLPDACYVLGDRTVSINPHTRKVMIRQYAWRQTTGACASGDLLTEGDFSEEVSLGRLPAGEYRVAHYPTGNGAATWRSLKVAVAQASTIDNAIYARVTSIDVPDLALATDNVRVRITGLLTSDCFQLGEPLSVQQVEDTFVILPVENRKFDCISAPTPQMGRVFDRTLELGRLPPGRYLVHVRSNNGQVVERAFSVVQASSH
jgi:DNA gyrase inhibitor GyrI